MSIQRFSAEVALEYGFPAAVLFYDVAYWVRRNERTGQNQKEGKFWYFASYETMMQKHPYLSKYQIRQAIEKMEKDGLIQRGIFNHKAYDRTRWYTLGPNAVKFLPTLDTGEEEKLNHGRCKTSTKDGLVPYSPIQREEKKKRNSLSSSSAGEKNNFCSYDSQCSAGSHPAVERAFSLFWTSYPRKEGKKAAYRAFQRLSPEVWDKLGPALEVQRESRQWQDPKFIPLPAKWLKEARWEDETLEDMPSQDTRTTLPEGVEEVTLPGGRKEYRYVGT